MDENGEVVPTAEASPAMTFREITAGIREVYETTVALVVAAEQAIPEGGKGKDKLAQVVAGARAYAPLVGLSLALADTLAPMIEAFASRVVSLFNRRGWPK